MQRLRRCVEHLATIIIFAGGLGIIFSMLIGTADVLGTQFFNWPVPGAAELTASTMVLIVFGALATAQIRNAHIRVEIIYSRMSPRGMAILNCVAHLLALCFFGLLIWQAYGEAVISWNISESTEGLIRVPLFPARAVIVFGTGVLIAQLLLDLIRDIHPVIKKDNS